MGEGDSRLEFAWRFWSKAEENAQEESGRTVRGFRGTGSGEIRDDRFGFMAKVVKVTVRSEKKEDASTKGYRGCTHQRFLGGVCTLVIVLHDKLQLKKLAMGLNLTWKKLELNMRLMSKVFTTRWSCVA
ncbi:hypothetical protein F2Q70_00015659 [Brassica cretica]|uniref:Uncharacterized protein n=1 Tax=Brassica cretica TaxID=69181 RepID=A0A8S9I6A9_BRACR|nr:hypothetical protein F2Q70_00015659 [Brassica cretica]